MALAFRVLFVLPPDGDMVQIMPRHLVSRAHPLPARANII